MQNQSKDAFPSDTKNNPKECMAVTLRSGRVSKHKRRTLRKKSKHKLKKKSSWAEIEAEKTEDIRKKEVQQE